MTYTAPSGSHAPIPHGDLMESDEHDRLAQELEQQLALLKDPDERRQLTSPDSLHSHVACAKRLLASPSGYGSAVKLRCWLAMQQLATGRKLCMCCRCRSRALLLQLRLLRNCVALEPEVAGPGLLDTGLLEHVPQAVQALSAAEGEFFKGQRLLQGASHVLCLTHVHALRLKAHRMLWWPLLSCWPTGQAVLKQQRRCRRSCFHKLGMHWSLATLVSMQETVALHKFRQVLRT